MGESDWNFKRKIIEDWFPIETVGEEGRKEKISPSGRLSALHHWHARRPITAMRAVVLESLIDVLEDPEKYTKIKDFLTQYCQRFIPKQIYTSEAINPTKKQIDTQKTLNSVLSDAIGDRIIRTLDPFAGGGSIPLELAFAGCEIYATDLNPVSVLINKATIEYPIKYRDVLLSKLYPVIFKYAMQIHEELKSVLGTFFTNPFNTKNLIIFYLWARQIICTNEKCAIKIPLLKTLILDKDKKASLIHRDFINNEPSFEIGWSEDAKNQKGYYTKGAIVCPKCGTTISSHTVHELFQKNKLEDRLIAIYETTPSNERFYRVATEADYNLYKESKSILNPINPDLELPKRIWLWSIQKFGITRIKQMFNERQYLVASLLSDLIRKKKSQILKDCGEELTPVIMVYLQFGLDKLINYNSKFSIIGVGSFIANTWARPGLFVTGMYAETNPFSEFNSGCFSKFFQDLEKIFLNFFEHPMYNGNNGRRSPIILQMNAMELDFEDNYFDLIITDPPYYDNIPYAADSDYFYLWMRIGLSDIFPELFISEQTPKEDELIADPDLRGNQINAKNFYEKGMSKAFSESYRVLKPNGLSIVVFAHKKMDAWETLLNAFIQSQFVITATWPVPMERTNKPGAQVSASLTSIILVIARKIPRSSEIYFDKKFQLKIVTEIQKQMQRFWNQGLRGADFFMCAIGPSLTYFSLYERLLDPSTDQPIDVHEYLTFIQGIMVNFAVEKISQSAYSGSLDRITQFYLIWRWGYGLNILPFDEVKTLYQALTIELGDLEKNFLQKKKSKAEYECMSPNERFKNFDLKKREKFNSELMIDYLQFSSYLWEMDEQVQLSTTINNALLKFSDSFWVIAQALHDVLPECHERTQLQGLLQKYKKFVARENFKPSGEKTKQIQSTLFPMKKTKIEEQYKSEQEKEEGELEKVDDDEINEE